MSYPAAPWTLKGYAVGTLHLIDIRRSRIFVPSALEVIPVLPGHTLGGVYLSSYTDDSTLKYHELIVVSALVRYENYFGAWVSHIYVDNQDSVSGGREIWGLPKELAEFTWREGSISVFQNDQQLCHLDYKKDWFTLSTWWQQPFSIDAFGLSDSQFLLFNSNLEAQIGLLESSLSIPADSPFAKLQLDQPFLTLEGQKLNAKIGTPKVIGTR